MRWLAAFRQRLAALFSRRFESELDDEIRFHLEEATGRNLRRGMTPAQAERAARQSFGGVELTKERVRGQTGVRLLQDLAQDLRHAFRNLRRRPATAIIVVLTAAICIGANGAVFSIVHSILLKPLPFPDSGALVTVFNGYPDAGNPRSGNSVPDFYDRRQFISSFENVALFLESAFTLGSEDGGRHTFALQVTPSFFEVLGAQPLLGRLLHEESDDSAENRVVVIGHDLWRSAFSGADNVLGTTAILDGAPHTIVGVLPESFRFSTWDAQVFRSMVFSPEERADDRRHADSFFMIARLRADSSVGAAQAEVDALNAAILADYPAELRSVIADSGYHTEVQPYLQDMTRAVRQPFLLMWVGVLVVLLIGIANVTSILVVQARSRAGEVAVRAVLGAGRARILRQLATESMVLAVLGGLIGMVLAHWSLRLLGAFAVYEIPRVDDVSVDATAVGLMALAVLVLGVVAGVAPAWSFFGPAAGPGPGVHRGDTPRTSSFLHRALVSGQIALAFVLIMSAGLLVASLQGLLAVDPGFDPEGVAVNAMTLPATRYPDGEARLDYVRRLLDTVGAVGGVRSVAVASQLPFSGAGSRNGFVPDGVTRAEGESIEIPYRTIVSTDYFDTMQMQIVAGRGFRAGDGADAPRVAIIDENLAGRYWPGSEAVGQRFWEGGQAGEPGEALTIVGVVEGIRQNSLTEAADSGAYYLPLGQRPLSFYRLAAKLDVERASIWSLVQSRVAELDPELILFWADTMEGSLDASLILQRTPMQLLSAFASIGLFLGVLGVYGVMAFSVGRRQREIGLRMALGSTSRQVAMLVAREWAAVVGAGLTLGLVGAFASTRVIASLLYNTATLDMGVLLGAVAIVVAAALLACTLPVRRATRVDPAAVLAEG